MRKRIDHYGNLPSKILKIVKIFDILSLATDSDTLMPKVYEFDNVNEFRKFAMERNMVVKPLYDRKTGRIFLTGLAFSETDSYYFEYLHLAIPMGKISDNPVIAFVEAKRSDITHEERKILNAYERRVNTYSWAFVDEDDIQKFEDKLLSLFNIDRKLIEERRKKRELLNRKMKERGINDIN